MQTAKDIATNLAGSQRSTERDELTGLPTERQMAELWVRMTAMFGHRWQSAYGERDEGTWRAGLRGVLGEQIARGLRETA